jgi:O-antigen ligase
VLVYGLFVSSTFTIAGVEACIALLMALALWQRLQEGGAAWHGIPRWLMAGFLFLPIVAVVSAAANPGFLTTLDHLRPHYRLFLPFALLPALAFVSVPRVLRLYLAFVMLMAVYGAIQYRYGVDWFRPEGQKLITPYQEGLVFNAKGNFTHHLTYAGFMLINVPFFLALAAGAGGRERWLWAAGSAGAALATLLSLGRSGWLGMVVGVLVLATIRLPRRFGVALAAAGVAAILLVALLLATGWLRERLLHEGTPALVQRLVRTGLEHDVDRLRLWEAGWLALRDKPLLGHGWGNQHPALEPYRQAVSAKHGGYRFIVKASAGLHNIYLQVAFAAGALGLAAYLCLWGAVLAWCALGIARAGPGRHFEQDLLRGATGGIAGSMAAGWFENNFLDGEVQVLLMMMVGLALWAGLRIAREVQDRGTR